MRETSEIDDALASGGLFQHLTRWWFADHGAGGRETHRLQFQNSPRSDLSGYSSDCIEMCQLAPSVVTLGLDYVGASHSTIVRSFQQAHRPSAVELAPLGEDAL